MKTDHDERRLGWTTWTLILFAAAILPSCGGKGGSQGSTSGSGLNPSLSADGNFVAYDSSSVSGASSNSSQIFLFNNATGTTRQLTGSQSSAEFANGSNPALSADGSTLAFVSTSTVAPGTTTTTTTATTTGVTTGTSVGTTGTTVATTGTTLGTTLGTTGTTMGTTTGVTTSTTGLDTTTSTGSTTGTSTGFTTGIVTGTSAGTTTTSGSTTGFTTGIVTGTTAGTTSLTSGTSTGFTTGIVTGALAAVSFSGSSQIVLVNVATGNSSVVSVTSTGTLGNGDSVNPSISANGQRIAFESTSSNFVASTSGLAGRRNVFVTSATGGATQLVSFGFGGSVPNGDSINPMISADGRFVAFESVATNLIVGSVPGPGTQSRVFVRDLQTGLIFAVTPGQGALLPPNGDSTRPSISGDGRFVAFESTATNLVGQGGTGSAGRNIFVWDRLSGLTRLVTPSVDATGATSTQAANGDSLNPSISADGRFVAFKSRATDLLNGATSPGNLNVFVRDLVAGTTTLIAPASSGSTTGNFGALGTSDDNGSQDPVLSRDGTFVAYTQNTSGSSAGFQVFLTNRVTGETRQVSGSSAGASTTSSTTMGTTGTTTTTGSTTGTTTGTTSSAPTLGGLTP